ncbi:Coiled-coil domain-containing protein 12 [Trichinella pseudospiralis]|uniref:Coiled-coil domain-containing protein 12 n=2 Tax=Trichinella pseudospiralis TaxID=6337 RepID=A0A0V1K9I0_TRIPS|nr:Coiled-coil domain-containing protein 12 [Trichinella pseudospiralis]KRY88024.1 Coiled-coil domain-containing protein 12 [Trichinella pseudospiralis]KRZ30564.1 Coiled-coil domain-containing protein 12 [Trichinella pseudospiralis]KRZ43865.1 Coiled-coil domain-containing protein 12 [Trichinella pseudospiralis]
MSCTGCARKFKLTRAEKSCIQCHFVYCSKCLKSGLCNRCLHGDKVIPEPPERFLNKVDFKNERGGSSFRSLTSHENLTRAAHCSANEKDALLQKRLDALRETTSTPSNSCNTISQAAIGKTNFIHCKEMTDAEKVQQIMKQTVEEVKLDKELKVQVNEMDQKTKLEAEAEFRRKRLEEMKKMVKQDESESSNSENDEVADETVASKEEEDTESTAKENTEAKSLVFRNYMPVSENLKAVAREPAKPEDVIEELRDDIEQATNDDNSGEIVRMDLNSLAPRKIDWDLKRDLQLKLDKLERRTQKAIVQIISERLKAGNNDLLLSAVNSNAEAVVDSHMSDDD